MTATAKTYHAATINPQGNYRTVTSSDHTSKAAFSHELRSNGFKVSHVWSDEQYADVIAHGPNAETMSRSEYNAAELAQGYYNEVVIPRLQSMEQDAFETAKAEALAFVTAREDEARSNRAAASSSDESVKEYNLGALGVYNYAAAAIINSTGRDALAWAANELDELAINYGAQASEARIAGDDAAMHYALGGKMAAENARRVALNAFRRSQQDGPSQEPTHYAITTSWSRGPQLHECAGFSSLRAVSDHLHAKGLRVSEVMTAAKWEEKRHTLPSDYVRDLERESVAEYGERSALQRVTCASCGDFADGPEAVEAFGRSYCCEECAADDDVVRCQTCGQWVDASANTAIKTDDGSVFCSPQCAHDGGFHQCDNCGDWHDEDEPGAFYYNGSFYCGDDCAHEMGLERCESCGDWHDTSSYDAVYIDGVGCYCCDNCAESDGYVRCSDCGEWVDENESYYTGDERTICPSCREMHYYCCSDCEELYHEYDVHYCEDDDCYYCDDCIGDHDSAELVHSYSYTPAPEFYGGCGTHPFLGVELETDTEYSGYSCQTRDEYAAKLAERPELYLKHDGSLNSYGVEVVSHPCSLYHHLNSGLWEHVAQAARDHDYTSHDNGRCGLHIHIARSFFGQSYALQNMGGYKMMRILQRMEDDFTNFARRVNNHWCHYSTCYDYGDNPSKYDSAEKARHMVDSERDKYQALNFRHSATFEMRIFRGSLNLETLFASLCMADGLARYAKSHSDADCESVTFSELCSWIYTTQEYGKARSAFAAYLDRRSLSLPPVQYVSQTATCPCCLQTAAA